MTKATGNLNTNCNKIGVTGVGAPLAARNVINNISFIYHLYLLTQSNSNFMFLSVHVTTPSVLWLELGFL